MLPSLKSFLVIRGLNLDLSKSQLIDFSKGETLTFQGIDMKLVRSDKGKGFVLSTPNSDKVKALINQMRVILKKNKIK